MDLPSIHFGTVHNQFWGYLDVDRAYSGYTDMIGVAWAGSILAKADHFQFQHKG